METVDNLLHNISLQIIECWNKDDFAELYHHLNDSISFDCPYVKNILPDNVTDNIIGRENVIEYWYKAIDFLRNRKFEVVSYKANGKNAILENKIINESIRMVLYIQFNNYGKVIQMKAEYFDI